VLARPPYTSTLHAIQHELHDLAGRYAEPIRTVYIGGGRPSLLDADGLEGLFDTIHEHFDATALEEVTLELNPADAEADFLHAARQMGIDRVSLEVMSFFADDLAVLQAPHSAEQAEAALDAVQHAGFERFSVDVLFGWAALDPIHWKANLQKAIRLGAPHLAVVECTGDQFAEAPDDVRAAQYQFAIDFLPDQGFEQYEVSHFARPGQRGIHNARHWDHSNYLGVGPAAHSFWWDGLPAHRWSNVGNLPRYEALLRQHHRPLAQQTSLDLPALADEYVMLRLRTADGLDLDTLATRYQVDLAAQKADTLARLEDAGMLAIDADRRIHLTPQGLQRCDAVTQKLLPN
jgi:oxygen-independent coproporphyrinogen-3 oxidase